MEEFEDPSPEYIKGFNEGYLLAKHEPELAEKLATVPETSIQLSGFKKGIEEFQIEKKQEKYPSWLRQDRLSSLNRSMDKEMDDKSKDEIDRE